MSDGSRIRCRLEDAGDLLSVYVDRDYDRMGVTWRELRTVVDVGSTVGAFTVWALQQAPQAKAIAIEPNPEVYPFLVDNIRLNQLTDRVTTLEVALGEASGQAQIEDREAISTLVRVVPVGSGTGATVKMLSLDGVFREMKIEQCDLLKIDCEGCEYEILLATPDGVLKAIDTIICEYHPVDHHDPKQLVDRLSDIGFRVDRDYTEIGFILATRTL